MFTSRKDYGTEAIIDYLMGGNPVPVYQSVFVKAAHTCSVYASGHVGASLQMCTDKISHPKSQILTKNTEQL